MATYNGEPFIRQQLESFSRQTLLPSELIVCDDGSTDATVSIVSDFSRSAHFPSRSSITLSGSATRPTFFRRRGCARATLSLSATRMTSGSRRNSIVFSAPAMGPMRFCFRTPKNGSTRAANHWELSSQRSPLSKVHAGERLQRACDRIRSRPSRDDRALTDIKQLQSSGGRR